MKDLIFRIVEIDSLICVQIPKSRNLSFFQVEPIPDPDKTNQGLIRIQKKENGIQIQN